MHYIKKVFARVLRKEQTPAEKKVWGVLRNRQFMNLKFRRQHVIEGFVVDFYCHELRLAVEVDGGVHAAQKEYDVLRQSLIEEKGITVIRIANEEIQGDLSVLLNRIRTEVKL